MRVSVNGLRAGDTSADLTAVIDLPRKRTLKETFLSPDISDVNIKNGKVAFKEYGVSDITGNVKLQDGDLSKGELLFRYDEEYFILDIRKIKKEPASFYLRLRSKDYTLRGRLFPEKDALVIEKFRGRIFNLNADLAGEIRSLSKTGKRNISLEGHIGGKIRDVLLLPLGPEKIIGTDLSGGAFAASFETHFAEDNIKALNLLSAVKVDRISFKDVDLEKISGKISIGSGLVSISEMIFFLAKYPVKLELSMDMNNKDLPLILKTKAAGMDVKEALSGLQLPSTGTYGPLDLNLSFSGSGKNLYSAVSHLVETGTLYPDETIFHEMELSGLISLDSYLGGKNRFDDIFAEFSMKNGDLKVSKISFRSFGGHFDGKGRISFVKKDMPLIMEISAGGLDPRLIAGDISGEEISLEGPLDIDLSLNISGKMISDAYGEPGADDGKDDLPRIKRAWRTFLIPEHREAFSRAKVSIIAKLKRVSLKGIPFTDISVNAGLDDGMFKISSLSMNSQGGTIQAEADILADHADFPVYLNTRVNNVDLSDISRKILNSPGFLEGPADIAFSFSGYGSVLSKIAEHMEKLEKKDKATTREKLSSSLFLLSEKHLFKGQKAAASFSFSALRAGNIKFDNIYGKLSLKEGDFSIAGMNGIFYRGPFTSDLYADLNTLGFPFTLKAEVKKSDLKALVTDTIDKSSPVHGNLDFNVQVKGKAEYQTSYSGYGSFDIQDANLGRVPILTPLLGWIYEGLEDIFPVFKKININSAEATFTIKDRKISTEDLVLSGSDISLVAEGSLDFDGQLDFYFENELIAREIPDDADWPVSVRNFITSFGKTMSRARLRGTLKDQKWEFEYLAPMRKAIDRNIKAFFEGLSR
ncbi:MAG: AsmA-like C-terminal region-containing protein [Candidatus Omnitrophota bacterium]